MTQEIESFAMGPNHVRFLLSTGQTGGKFSLTEFTAAPPPAPSAPAHIHQDADETLYILEGDFEFLRDGEVIPAPQGSFILIPKGVRHGVRNAGTAPGRMLVILAPPGFEHFWKERSELAARQGDALDGATLLALQEKYHMDTSGQVRQLAEERRRCPGRHESPWIAVRGLQSCA